MNGTIRRKLAEAEEPLTTIGEWQERAVRLDRNQRQSRVEERMLGRNAVCPGGNAQPRESFGGGSYGGSVMNIEWDYNYYQPWSDNEWLVDEMLAMLDEDIIMQ